MNTNSDKPAPVKNLRGLLAEPRYAQAIRETLGRRAPQFVSSLLSAANGMPGVEPVSIISAAMTAAVLDLPIEKNLGFAWIVPYEDKKTGRRLAQFQMGWKGYIQLAWRSGQYKTITPPRAINAEALGGYDSIGVPLIDWNRVDESKPAVGYAFGWRLVNGGEQVFYWPLSRIETHAQRYSQSYRSGKGSPWQTHPDEMRKKTLVKNSFNQFGILSVQMQTALLRDQSIQRALEAEVEWPDHQPPQSRAPALLKNKPKQPEPEANPEPEPTIPTLPTVETGDEAPMFPE